MGSFESAPVPAPVTDDVSLTLTEQLSVLESLDDRPLSEHPDVYQQLHANLQATLAEIDSA